MLWALLAILVIVAGIMAKSRKVEPTEAWRESLEADDEPLDIEAIREAEEEWNEDSSWIDEDDDEVWR